MLLMQEKNLQSIKSEAGTLRVALSSEENQTNKAIVSVILTLKALSLLCETKATQKLTNSTQKTSRSMLRVALLGADKSQAKLSMIQLQMTGRLMEIKLRISLFRMNTSWKARLILISLKKN